MRTLMVIVLVLTAAGVVAWRFEPVREYASNHFPGLAREKASSAQTPAPMRRMKTVLPTEVALIQPVVIPAVVNGRTAGSVTLPPGTMAKIAGVEGPNLKLRYLNSLVTAPRAATDYDRRVKMVPDDAPAPAASAASTPVIAEQVEPPPPAAVPSPTSSWSLKGSALDARPSPRRNR